MPEPVQIISHPTFITIKDPQDALSPLGRSYSKDDISARIESLDDRHYIILEKGYGGRAHIILTVPHDLLDEHGKTAEITLELVMKKITFSHVACAS